MDRTELNNWIAGNDLHVGDDGQVFYHTPGGTDPDQFYFAFDRSRKLITLPGGMRVQIKDINKLSIDSNSFNLSIQTKTMRYTVAPQVLPVIPLDMAAQDTYNISMPKTDSELNDLFPVMYPEYKEKLIYDVLREREMVDISILDPDKPDGSFVDFSENIEYRFYDDIERRLKDIGCTGAPPNTSVRFRVLFTKFHENRKNAFLDWLKTLTWDGVCRVDTWFQRVFNANAAILNNPKMEELYLARVSRAWFIGAISRCFQETVHEVVPVLIGKQACGKTSGLRYTAVKREWFIDTTADVSSQQAVLKFLDSVRGKIIIEMAESTQIRSKDQESLKAFITKSTDQYRKPYARRDDDFPRHFILAASSNLTDVFTDVTGNRRYYPIFCGKADFTNRTPYDAEQVWAEAFAMYQAGEVCHIREDWYPAMVMQKQTTQDNNNITIIDDWLDKQEHGYSMPGSKICEKQIYRELFGYGETDLIRPEHRIAVRAWKNGSPNWTPCTPIKYMGKSERAVERIHYPGENVDELLTPHLTPEDLYNQSVETSEMIPWSEKSRPLEDRFADLCREARYEGSVVPNDMFNPGEIKKLVDLGYIYKVRTGNKYRILAFPEKVKSEINDQ